jgi:maltooligosyltrehalose synthase
MITAVPRAGRIDPETLFRLPVGTWRNILADHEHGGGTIAAAALWLDFPVALLVKQP